jgi:hypothetical protein
LHITAEERTERRRNGRKRENTHKQTNKQKSIKGNERKGIAMRYRFIEKKIVTLARNID